MGSTILDRFVPLPNSVLCCNLSSVAPHSSHAKATRTVIEVRVGSLAELRLRIQPHRGALRQTRSTANLVHIKHDGFAEASKTQNVLLDQSVSGPTLLGLVRRASRTKHRVRKLGLTLLEKVYLLLLHQTKILSKEYMSTMSNVQRRV